MADAVTKILQFTSLTHKVGYLAPSAEVLL